VLEIEGTADYTGTNLRFGAVADQTGTIHTTTTGTFNAIGDGNFSTLWAVATRSSMRGPSPAQARNDHGRCNIAFNSSGK